MEQRHLRYFLAVAEDLNFTSAAARLHIAQPSLSKQIRLLEEELQVELLRRTNRRVELTPAGEYLVVQAREIIERAEHLGEAVRRVARGQSGRLRIGYTQSAVYDVLPALLMRFRQRHPDVEVVLSQPSLTPAQERALEGGQVDAAILRPPLRSATLSMLVLRREVFLVALPERHPLARRSRVALTDLAQQEFVSLPVRDSVLAVQTLVLCEHAGFRPRIQQEAGELDTVIRLVAAGFGVALVPSAIVKAAVPGVAYRPLRRRSPTLDTCLAWRVDDETPTVRALVELAREYLNNDSFRL